MHAKPHPYAGKLVELKLKGSHPHIPPDATEIYVEDWQDRVYGISWMEAVGNPAALLYAIYAAETNLPVDNNVIYGKVGVYGHIVHNSELGEPITQ
jgi:hypothetical protein